jgi:hypothetical protein
MNRVMYEIDHGFIPRISAMDRIRRCKGKPLQMNWESHGLAFHLQVHDNFLEST